MLWFSYMITPLGYNLRTQKSFVVDYDLPSNSRLLNNLRNFFTIQELPVGRDSGERLSNLMTLVRLDPDAADLVRLGVEKIVVARIE